MLIQPDRRRHRSFLEQPLAIAILAALTPKDIEVEFYDEGLEKIPYYRKTDLVAITVNIFTAKKAYEISREFKKYNVPVVLGGIHPSLVPEEAIQYCDSVAIGEAEEIWLKIIGDLKINKLKRFYVSSGRAELDGILPMRDIFKGKKYLPYHLVEFGRGCRHSCSFCAVSSFYKSTYTHRSIKDLIREIKGLERGKLFCFVDDNIAMDSEVTKNMLRELCKLNVKWMGQASTKIIYDKELLDLMAKSGCLWLHIGFEAIDNQTLKRYNKHHNLGVDYGELVNQLRERGISVHGTFIFDWKHSDQLIFSRTLEFALKYKLFYAGFNLYSPIPGTPLYKELLLNGEICSEPWWLIGNREFVNKMVGMERIKQECTNISMKFYKVTSILRRVEFKANFRSCFKALFFLFINFIKKIGCAKKKNI